MGHRVRGATDFERADRLKVFQLKVNVGRRFARIKANERRAQRGTGNQFASGVNVGKGRELVIFHGGAKLSLEEEEKIYHDSVLI